MNEICVACNRPIRDGDVVLELRNGVFRNGEVSLEYPLLNLRGFLHAGDADGKCLNQAGVKSLVDEVGIRV